MPCPLLSCLLLLWNLTAELRTWPPAVSHVPSQPRFAQPFPPLLMHCCRPSSSPAWPTTGTTSSPRTRSSTALSRQSRPPATSERGRTTACRPARTPAGRGAHGEHMAVSGRSSLVVAVGLVLACLASWPLPQVPGPTVAPPAAAAGGSAGWAAGGPSSGSTGEKRGLLVRTEIRFVRAPTRGFYQQVWVLPVSWCTPRSACMVSTKATEWT